MTDADYSLKIITLGESGVGKTKILVRYKDNIYEDSVSNYYNNTDGVILVYDISNERSFSKIQYWINEIKSNSNIDNSTFILFGNKNDLEEERKVSFEEGKEYAEQNRFQFLEGSAKTGNNIKELFTMLVKNIMKKR